MLNWTELNNWAVGDPVLVTVATVRCVTGALAGCPSFRHVPGHHQQTCRMRGKRKPAEKRLKPREEEASPVRGGQNTHTYTNADRGALCPHTSWVELFVSKSVCVCVWSHMSANYAAVADHWIIHTYKHNVSDETASVCFFIWVSALKGPFLDFPSLCSEKEKEKVGPWKLHFTCHSKCCISSVTHTQIGLSHTVVLQQKQVDTVTHCPYHT